MTQAQIERIASRMPRTEALGDYLYRFQHAPTFEGSAWVGGAHASALLDATLVEVVSDHDRLTAELLLKAIMHLVLDFTDQCGIHQVTFLFPFQDRVVSYPVPVIAQKLSEMRQQFRIQVPAVLWPKVDWQRPDYLAFMKHDIHERNNGNHTNHTNGSAGQS